MRPAAVTRPAPVAVERFRLACVGMALALLTFTQSSGLEAADTKLDLVVAPARFLRKALVMWDPAAAAGQLQDQAYGYLFPMGPFFLLGKLSALSPWVVQRSWESLLLIAAFLGVVRLARLLGVPGFWPRVGAGLAYALAPRMLMELGVISAELLPVVVLPWVLIPLVQGASGGSARRAAARSGIALLFASGINAAATLAVLPVPALWLLTRSPGPRRRALMSWWAASVVLASLWWIAPLLVLGRYSPPFLDWIESSSVTTSQTSLIAVLRGVDHWQAYLGPNVWPAGWILAAAPAAILATTAVAATGLAGLARPTTPHRLFLGSVLLAGLVLVTLGHVSTVGPPFAGSLRTLLDGALAPFRNVHKFDPVVRMPIAIGLGHALAEIGRRVPSGALLRTRGAPLRVHLRALTVIAILGVAATAITPALAGRIVPQTRVTNDPSWWTQAGSWLGKHSAGGRALVVPGAAQPAYLWGEPRDDALQPVARSPWTVRDATPLSQPGYVRLLDAIEATLAGGQPDPALASVLARSGIRYLVVRNDLDAGASGATSIHYVYSTISNSPGFVPAASFGPRLEPSEDPARLVDLGSRNARGAVEVFENTRWRARATLLPASGAVVANGSSDQLPQLVAAGVSPETPVIFGREPRALARTGLPTSRVLTEGTRRREFGFGGVNRYSATMTAEQPFGATRAVHDYLPAGAAPLSAVQYTGISDVRVSSAAAAGESGWQALDLDPRSAWVSRSISGAVGQWIEITLPRPIAASSVLISFAEGQSSYPIRVRVTTDAGVVRDDVAPDSHVQPLPLPDGRTRSIRLTVDQMSTDRRDSAAAVASLILPGVVPSRTLVIPGVSDPDTIAFQRLAGSRPPCLTVSGAAACEPGWSAVGEEDSALDRTFRLADAGAYRSEIGVVLQPGTLLDNLLDAGNPVRAIASSVDSDDPRERAGAAIDGNPRTGWVAKPGDGLPSIELTTSAPHRIDGVELAPIVGAPVARPERIRVVAGSLSLEIDVPEDGRIRFAEPQTTQSVTITVLSASLRVDTDSETGRRRLLPVGVGELRLLGDDVPVPHGASSVRAPCGRGPTLFVNGQAVALELTGSAEAALSAQPLPAQVCNGGSLQLPRGLNRLNIGASALFRPQSVTLRRLAAAPSSVSPLGTLDVVKWADTRRDINVRTATPAFLSVPENANAAWSATLKGKRLVPVTLDGWHQGWLVPAGATGVVHLVFGPQRLVTWGLVLGILAVLLLLATAFIPHSGGDPERPAAGEHEIGRRAVLFGAVIGLAAIGGVVGILMLGAVWAFARQRGRASRQAALSPGSRAGLSAVFALVVAPILLAGAAAASRPPGSAHPLSGSVGVQVLCLVTLAALGCALLPAPTPRPAESPEQRSLDEVVRERGGEGGGDGREDEERDEMSPEYRPMHPALDQDQQRKVP